MIIKSIQHILDFVGDNSRMRIYKTIQDTKTMKEHITCEVYTYKGIVYNFLEKGQEIDKKV